MQLRKQFNIPSLAPRGAGGSGKDAETQGYDLLRDSFNRMKYSI